MIFFNADAHSDITLPQRKPARSPAWRRFASVGTVALGTAVLLGISATAQAVSGFQVQASSNVAGSDYNELDGVTDIGAVNDTAVGFYRTVR